MLASDSSLSRQVFKTSAAHSSVEAELEERNLLEKETSALQTHLNQMKDGPYFLEGRGGGWAIFWRMQIVFSLLGCA